MQTLNLVVLTLAAVIFDCYCSNEATLQNDLMGIYNTNIVPKNGKAAVQVKIDLGLLAIVEFNEIKETITSNYIFELQWTDMNLVWNPSDYGNVTETVFKQKQLWLPDIYTVNAVHGIGHLGDEDLLLLVTYDGNVKWTSIATVETICKVNTEYFPYDKQSCAVQLTTTAQTRHMINVTIPEPIIGTRSFTENGQWHVTATSANILTLPNHQLSYFRLHLTRRHEYYVTSLIIPILFVSVLNCFVLMLPKSSGENIGFSITVFLSYMVLLSFTADYLPRTSEYEPYIVNYIGIMLGLSFTSVICSVISLCIQSALTKSKSDRPDGLPSSLDTDTPIISIVHTTASSTDTCSSNIKSNVTEVKPVWEEQEEVTIDIGHERHCYKIAPIKQQLKGLKIYISKCLRYFDIIASFCITLTTGYVTLTTMTSLTNGN